jgi:hypothetical protein
LHSLKVCWDTTDVTSRQDTYLRWTISGGYVEPKPLVRPRILDIALIRCINSHVVPRRYLADSIHLHGKLLDTVWKDPEVTQFFVIIEARHALANQAIVFFAVFLLSKGHYLSADQIAEVEGRESEEGLITGALCG